MSPGCPSTGYAVRSHDVAVDEPPGDGFDLVHARLVLTHVPERVAAMARMARACGRAGAGCSSRTSTSTSSPKPSPTRLDPVHYRGPPASVPASCRCWPAATWTSSWAASCPGCCGSQASSTSRRDAFLPLAVPATASLERANVEQVRAGIVGWSGTTEEDIDAHLEAVTSGAVTVSTPPMISAWGRRPAV